MPHVPAVGRSGGVSNNTIRLIGSGRDNRGVGLAAASSTVAAAEGDPAQAGAGLVLAGLGTSKPGVSRAAYGIGNRIRRGRGVASVRVRAVAWVRPAAARWRRFRIGCRGAFFGPRGGAEKIGGSSDGRPRTDRRCGPVSTKRARVDPTRVFGVRAVRGSRIHRGPRCRIGVNVCLPFRALSSAGESGAAPAAV